jgi:nucleotide-binding universal stress UspA family protein
MAGGTPAGGQLRQINVQPAPGARLPPSSPATGDDVMQTHAGAGTKAGYASIMVPLHLGADATDRVTLAAGLAERFGSRLIGIGAEDFALPYAADATASVEALLIDEAKRTAQDNLQKAERAFRAAAHHLADIEWRSAMHPPRGFALAQARAADLVVLGRYGSNDTYQGAMGLTPGDLVMDLGRPLLVVPPLVTALAARHVLIAWKDTREARRAVSDAMPFLMRADQVTVLAVGSDGAEPAVADVGAYLCLHGIPARAIVRRKVDGGIAGTVVDYAIENGSDLIVSGAYGHSRMREWMFGGVTLDLLEEAPVCCLMSH